MQIRDRHTCAVSGIRPHKLPRSVNLFHIQNNLRLALLEAVLLGYTTFLCGGAMGVDIWAGEILVDLRMSYPEIRIHCVLPCKTQADNWPQRWRERYLRLMEQADQVTCLQEQYTAGCMLDRNRWMVDRSNRLVAVHNGVDTGGTAYTIRYTQAQGIQTDLINVLELV